MSNCKLNSPNEAHNINKYYTRGLISYGQEGYISTIRDDNYPYFLTIVETEFGLAPIFDPRSPDISNPMIFTIESQVSTASFTWNNRIYYLTIVIWNSIPIIWTSTQPGIIGYETFQANPWSNGFLAGAVYNTFNTNNLSAYWLSYIADISNLEPGRQPMAVETVSCFYVPESEESLFNFTDKFFDNKLDSSKKYSCKPYPPKPCPPCPPKPCPTMSLACQLFSGPEVNNVIHDIFSVRIVPIQWYNSGSCTLSSDPLEAYTREVNWALSWQTDMPIPCGYTNSSDCQQNNFYDYCPPEKSCGSSSNPTSCKGPCPTGSTCAMWPDSSYVCYIGTNVGSDPITTSTPSDTQPQGPVWQQVWFIVLMAILLLILVALFTYLITKRNTSDPNTADYPLYDPYEIYDPGF